MTPYQKHKLKWSRCTKCLLCTTRRKVVLARGKIPASVLFIGEAPGVSEDVLGTPFIGPAGKLLDRMITKAGLMDYCMTNLICCIPRGEDGDKTAEPPEEAILACQERLKEIIVFSNPQAIVCVGKLSQKWVPKMTIKFPPKMIGIVHPAAILRADIAQRGLAIQQVVVALTDLAESLL